MEIPRQEDQENIPPQPRRIALTGRRPLAERLRSKSLEAPTAARGGEVEEGAAACAAMLRSGFEAAAGKRQLPRQADCSPRPRKRIANPAAEEKEVLVAKLRDEYGRAGTELYQNTCAKLREAEVHLLGRLDDALVKHKGLTDKVLALQAALAGHMVRSDPEESAVADAHGGGTHRMHEFLTLAQDRIKALGSRLDGLWTRWEEQRAAVDALSSRVELAAASDLSGSLDFANHREQLQGFLEKAKWDMESNEQKYQTKISSEIRHIVQKIVISELEMDGDLEEY